MSWTPREPDRALEARRRRENFDQGRGDIHRDGGRDLLSIHLVSLLEAQERLTGEEREQLASLTAKFTSRVTGHLDSKEQQKITLPVALPPANPTRKELLFQRNRKRAMTSREAADELVRRARAQRRAIEHRSALEARVTQAEAEDQAEQYWQDLNPTLDEANNNETQDCIIVGGAQGSEQIFPPESTPLAIRSSQPRAITPASPIAPSPSTSFHNIDEYDPSSSSSSELWLLRRRQQKEAGRKRREKEELPQNFRRRKRSGPRPRRRRNSGVQERGRGTRNSMRSNWTRRKLS